MAAAGEGFDLSKLAGQLSAGDVSVLREGLNSPGNQMMTTAGSANDLVWTVLADRGLMKLQPLPEAVAEKLKGSGVMLRIYSVAERGQNEIPALFPQLNPQ